MDASTNQDRSQLQQLTAEIVASYVANNSVQRTDLPQLISSVYGSLTNLGKAQEVEPQRPTPPVPIRKTITDEYLISLEDGKRYKSLKRHLAGRGLTPQQYREKWGLKADYPMTAPAYAQRRSELAKSIGLGRKRAEAAVPPKGSGRARKAKAA